MGKALVYAIQCMAIVLLVACSHRDDAAAPNYSLRPLGGQLQGHRLAPHPLYRPQVIYELFQPLVDYLNQEVPGLNLELESSRDYASFEKKIRAREVDILMPNPWQTLEAIKSGYTVISMWGDAKDFKGIFIVRKDSNIKTPQDLIGKAVSYPSPTALAAGMMTQYYLYQHGIDVNRDILNLYVGTHESAIMNVYMGNTVAGATWPPPWQLFQMEHPLKAAELQQIWETEPLINNSVMVRDDLPQDLRKKLQEALFNLSNSAQGRRILDKMQTAKFHPATDETYAPARAFVETFEREVRPATSQ